MTLESGLIGHVDHGGRRFITVDHATARGVEPAESVWPYSLNSARPDVDSSQRTDVR